LGFAIEGSDPVGMTSSASSDQVHGDLEVPLAEADTPELIARAVEQTVKQDVERKVAAKLEELWQRGKLAMGQAQRKHVEKMERLTEEVSRCHKRQQVLEAENQHLKQVLASLDERFSVLGALFPGRSSGQSAQAEDIGTGFCIASPLKSPTLTAEGRSNGQFAQAEDIGTRFYIASPLKSPTLAAEGCSSPPGTASTDASGTTVASVAVSRSSSDWCTLEQLQSPQLSFASCGAMALGATGQLPEVPPFPFPDSQAASAVHSPGHLASPGAPPAAVTSPFLLAEALGTPDDTTVAAGPCPQPTPLSLASSLPLSPVPKAHGQETSHPFGVVGFSPCLANHTFRFTLRKADNTDLGLVVSPVDDGQALYIENIRTEGAVEAWNRQCMNAASLEKVVIRGDRITSVNSVTLNADAMLLECKERQLLKITVVRGEGPVQAGVAYAPKVSAASSLRADASVFVPSSQVPASAVEQGQGGQTDAATESDAATTIISSAAASGSTEQAEE